MVNILFFLSNLKPGGAQRTIVNIINHLDKSKYYSTLILFDYNKNQAYSNLIPKELKIYNLDTRGRHSIFKISRIIKVENPDICFATLPQVAKALTLAHKITRHNSKVILRETNYRPRKEITLLDYITLKYSYQYSDHIIALTKGLNEQIKKQYKIKDDKITIIYNPVNKQFIEKKIKDSNNPFQENYFNLVSCGSLIKQKNYIMLLNSMKLIKEKNFNNIKLHILGEGPLNEKLKNLIISSNLDDTVHLVGHKKNPFIYMKHADLFILSSLYEGMPNVVLESLASGTPVLSTDCPTGPKEILGNNEYGWTVPNDNYKEMAEKIIELYNNPKEIRSKKILAKNRAEVFSVQKIIKEYESLFSLVLM